MAYEELLMDGMPFDITRLPHAYGPKSTEALIEAIFNPVPTHSMAVSPFTYFVPPEPKGKGPLRRASAENAKMIGMNNGAGGEASTMNGDGSGIGTRSEAASLYSMSGSEDTHSSVRTSATRSSGRLSSRSWRSRSSHNLKERGAADNGKLSSTRWWKKLGHRSRPGTPGG
jgi:hypothetical protein